MRIWIIIAASENASEEKGKKRKEKRQRERGEIAGVFLFSLILILKMILYVK